MTRYDMIIFSSIRFQNPSYDRRDEVAVTLGSLVPHVSPGQHEYTNPINDNLLKVKVEQHITFKHDSIFSNYIVHAATSIFNYNIHGTTFLYNHANYITVQNNC